MEQRGQGWRHWLQDGPPGALPRSNGWNKRKEADLIRLRLDTAAFMIRRSGGNRIIVTRSAEGATASGRREIGNTTPWHGGAAAVVPAGGLKRADTYRPRNLKGKNDEDEIRKPFHKFNPSTTLDAEYGARVPLARGNYER